MIMAHITSLPVKDAVNHRSRKGSRSKLRETLDREGIKFKGKSSDLTSVSVWEKGPRSTFVLYVCVYLEG